jgi:hypothetical protein
MNSKRSGDRASLAQGTKNSCIYGVSETQGRYSSSRHGPDHFEYVREKACKRCQPMSIVSPNTHAHNNITLAWSVKQNECTPVLFSPRLCMYHLVFFLFDFPAGPGPVNPTPARKHSLPRKGVTVVRTATAVMASQRSGLKNKAEPMLCTRLAV